MDTTDPIALLERLDPDAIAARLEEIEREGKALRVLLRSARARQNSAGRRKAVATPTDGGGHAA